MLSSERVSGSLVDLLSSLSVGETIKIIIEEYVQHLSGYHFQLKFDPELLFNQQFQYQNRISSEFNTLYHWHPLMPDDFRIQDEVYSYKQFLYNTSIVTDHGISNLVDSFSKQIAGRVSRVSHSSSDCAFLSSDPGSSLSTGLKM